MKVLSGIAAIPLCLGLFSGTANAVPTLQLGIEGGTYNWATQTVTATSPAFSLYAFLTPDSTTTLSTNYFLSMAVTPEVSTGVDLGSFAFTTNGTTTTYNVTGSMQYGVPPMETNIGFDSRDLAQHGIYETYFTEYQFNFNEANQSGIFNTQDHPSWGPQAGTGMYYQLFNIDTSNLLPGHTIHFDLYSEKCSAKSGSICTDVDVRSFAPFSHDAQSAPPPVPEPESYALLLAGLGLLGLTARRRKQSM